MSQILGYLSKIIIAVKGTGLIRRNPKRLGDCARYRADELTVVLTVWDAWQAIVNTNSNVHDGWCRYW